MLFADTNSALKTVSEVFRKIASAFFSWHSLLVLLVSLAVALVAGRLVAALLRRLVAAIGARADRTPNLGMVNRLRRFETVIVLSIAVIRTLLVVFALYFWWSYIHPTHQPSAILGASAVLIVVLGNTLAPALRDITSGSLMMAEQWYGVGDHIRIEPFEGMQGVVERVTLRSTRIRGLNGEIMWVNNQNIAGVRITPKGIRTIALELFVTDLAAGEKLVSETNRRLPSGPLLLVSPLAVVETAAVGEQLWQITAVGETAPGREWLLEDSAVTLIKWLDKQRKNSVIAHGPLARFADSEAERRFVRTMTNARKRPAPKKRARKKSPKP